MNNDSTGPDVGQKTDVSAKPENRTDELIRLLENNVKAIVRMTSVMTDLTDRMNAVEARLKIIDSARASGASGDVPVSDVPSLALRSDGRVLLRIDELDEKSVGTRELWTGVLLTNAEATDVVDDLASGFAAAAASIAAWLNRLAAKEAAEPTPVE